MEYTLLPNPFNWPCEFLLEAFRRLCGEACTVVCYIPYRGEGPATYLQQNGCGSLIVRPCHLDLDELELRLSAGGWFLFKGQPDGALEQYRAVAKAHARGEDCSTTSFRLKQFELYYDGDAELILYMPVLSGLYEMQIECGM